MLEVMARMHVHNHGSATRNLLRGNITRKQPSSERSYQLIMVDLSFDDCHETQATLQMCNEEI
jgi:hypothetical protein